MSDTPPKTKFTVGQLVEFTLSGEGGSSAATVISARRCWDGLSRYELLVSPFAGVGSHYLHDVPEFVITNPEEAKV